MLNPNRFTCCIIGQTSLTLQCAQLLKEAGHTILGVVSNYKAFIDWARTQHIPVCANVSLLEDPSITYDYLFSIVNSHVLSADILSRPRYFGINFHDAVLPRYAGLHATSWAILKEELEHGITWHLLESGIDTGDILKQVSIPIEPKETGWSLNLKCFEAAKQSFGELIEELSQQSYQRRPQDPKYRTYYGAKDKPPYNGLIQWDASAHTISALVRALQLGHYANALATAKLIWNDELLVIQNLEITHQVSHQKPGTIVEVSERGICIATATQDVLLTQLSRCEDFPFIIEDIPGYFLKNPSENKYIGFDPLNGKNLETQSQIQARYESFWIKQWKKVYPLSLPFLNIEARIGDALQSKQRIAAFSVPEDFLNFLKSYFPSMNIQEACLAILSIYLYRVTQLPYYSFALGLPNIRASLKNLSHFFSMSVPYTVEVKDNQNFAEVLKQTQEHLIQFQNKGSYLKDIFLRYPDSSSLRQKFLVTILLIEEISAVLPKTESLVDILILKDKSKIEFHLSESMLESPLHTLLLNLPHQLLTLCTALVQQSQQKIAKLPLLSKEEQERVLMKWNDTAAPIPQKTALQLFEEQVLQRPNHIAVVFEQQSLTYEELNARANQLALYLREKGIKKGSYIALCLEQNLFIPIALLGILKVGGVYVPMDPEDPITRIKDIINETAPIALMTQLSVFNTVFATKDLNSSFEIILIDQLNHFVDERNLEHFESTDNSLEDLAYIIYTSGSTGKAKGVLISHRGLSNCLIYAQFFMKINYQDIFLSITSLSFDLSVFAYYIPLSIGATIIIAGKKAHQEAPCLIKLIKLNKVTILQATPCTLDMLKVQNWKSEKKLKILSGGEALAPTLASYLKENGEVFNVYGPTETTVYATIAEIRNSQITIGNPIANTQVYVLDKNLQPLPIGYAGELYIAGIGLAKGYLNQPQLTQQKFISNPFSKDPKALFYKTGDWVRWLPNGELEYLGRMDHQVKIRGFRIELGEIEHALHRHPSIAQAVVIAKNTTESHKQLVAFLVLHDPNVYDSLYSSQLHQFLEEWLPHYMIPAVFTVLEAFPLTINGKIDRRALENQSFSVLPAYERYQPPQTALEKQLSRVFEKILKISAIGLEDDFFALGGDSILAMQLMASIENDCGLTFSLADFLKLPTLAHLCEIVQSISSKEILINEFTDTLIPLTPIQQWFFQHAWVAASQWSQACLMQTTQRLNLDYFEQAMRALIMQHDALRMYYSKNPQGWQQHQKSADEVIIIFETVSCQEMPSEEECLTQWGQKIQARFDLEQGGALIGVMIWRDAKRIVADQILIVIHHLIIDGVSWRILWNQLAVFYQSLMSQQSLPELPASTSFCHWANALQRLSATSHIRAEYPYWLKVTEKWKALPQDYSVKEDAEYLTSKIHTQLNEECTHILLHKGYLPYGIQLNEILLAALVKTFSPWLKSKTLILDLESHGRQDEVAGLSSLHTLGWFTSLFPASLTLTHDTWEGLLLSIKEQVQAIPHHGLGYGLLRYLCKDTQISNSLAAQPKPHVCFNYWGKLESLEENALFQWKNLGLLAGPENHRTHWLTVDCVVQEGCLNILWGYNHRRHEAQTMEHLVQNYRQALIECAQHLESLSSLIPNSEGDIANSTIQPRQTHKENNLNKSLKEDSIKENYGLTPLQQGLLVQRWREPTSHSYEIQLHWEIKQALNLQAYQKAWNTLIQRHTILRTSLHWAGLEEPGQRIHPHVSLPLDFQDWRAHHPEKQLKQLKAFLTEDKQNQIDLGSFPLFRVTLIQFSDTFYHAIWHTHHILLDGWSFAILRAELEKCYQAYTSKTPIHLEPAYPFSDYLDWLKEQDWASSKAFWESYLEGFTETTSLGLTHSAITSEHQFSSQSIEQTWTLEQTQKLKDYARANGLTANTIFQGLWGLLLKGYSSSKDIVFGITVSGRTIPMAHIQQRVGLFIHTVPLRMPFNSSLTVIDYLKQIQQEFFTMLPHSHTSIEDIHTCSPLRGTSHALFESIMVFENYPAVSTESRLFEQLEFWDPTHYALNFIISGEDQITLKISFDEQRIFYQQIHRLFDHLHHLLSAIMADPMQPIHPLSALSEQEIKQLESLKGECVPYLSKTWIECFEEYVANQPYQKAIVYNDQHLTYEELNQHANKLTHYLKSKGLTPEMPVGCCLTRSIEWIISLLAIWKAGGVYVPLDPGYPSSRLQQMLVASDIRMILIKKDIFENTFEQTLSQENLTFIVLNECQEQMETYSIENPALSHTPDHLSYILYTSGTTGQPKGVAQEHKTLMNLTNWEIHTLSLKPQLNITQWAAMSFDVSLQEITYALGAGYTLHIVPKDIQSSLSASLKFLAQYEINQVFLPTALLEPFCEAGLISSEHISCITDIIVAGEALKISSLIKKFFSQHPHLRLTNHYGPTETHVVTSYTLPTDPLAWPECPPIGKAIQNTQLYVLDANRSLLPVGISGELYVGGAGVARGYLNCHQEQSERFFKNPWSTDPNALLYKTGDRVRWSIEESSQGQLEYLGRFDQQLKIRGYRIEPSEIESALLTQPDIRQCKVLAKPDAMNILQLVAYVIANVDVRPEPGALQQALAKQLPEYMIPQHFIWLETFPITSNGKVDQRALLSIEHSSINEKSIEIAQNHHEKELLSIWIETLKIKPIGIQDDFFALGGNSLIALRLLLRIEKQFNTSLNVTDLLLAPTIAKLSQRIQYLQAEHLLSTKKETLVFRNKIIPSPLVLLKSQGKRTPLFLIHPVGGTVFWFVDLARELGNERPVYGIQDPAILSDERFFNSLEEMATFYIHCIRQIQPEGPYLVAGASFGATMAFEIARQLKKIQQQVAFAGLLDGWAIYPKVLHEKEKFQFLMGRQIDELHQRFGLHELKNPEKWIDLQWDRNELLWQYPMTRLDQTLTLFKAASRLADFDWDEQTCNYWEDYSTQPIEVHLIPGDHASIFEEPNVKTLAKCIDDCLEKAEDKMIAKHEFL